jgi:hypothetical protein
MRASDQVTPSNRIAAEFDYSEAEWNEIEVSVQVVRCGSLPKKARELLRIAARDYLAGFAHPQRRAKSESRKKWEKIAALSAKLEQELAECDTSLVWPDYLSLLQTYAGALSEFTNQIVRPRDDDKTSPRLTYQSKVLEVWVGLGGKLRISRHKKSQRVQGPLARYFFAVTRPVMGASTPSPQSLRDILDRQKAQTGEIDAIMDEPSWFNLKGMYNWLCERQTQLLATELENARVTVGPDHPAVVQTERILGNGERPKA